jgi:hypothetical protein
MAGRRCFLRQRPVPRHPCGRHPLLRPQRSPGLHRGRQRRRRASGGTGSEPRRCSNFCQVAEPEYFDERREAHERLSRLSPFLPLLCPCLCMVWDYPGGCYFSTLLALRASAGLKVETSQTSGPTPTHPMPPPALNLSPPVLFALALLSPAGLPNLAPACGMWYNACNWHTTSLVWCTIICREGNMTRAAARQWYEVTLERVEVTLA